MTETPIRNLTILLLADSASKPEHALRDNHGAQRRTVALRGSLTAEIYIKQMPSRPPKWTGFSKATRIHGLRSGPARLPACSSSGEMVVSSL